MRKLVAVGLLVGGLLAMAGPAMAQGIGDPLTLAASGVLMPFFGDPGDTTLLEVASPVGPETNLHMFFFNASCTRVGDSAFLPLTSNDISTLQITGSGGFLTPLSPTFFGPHPQDGGLIAIADSADGFTMVPLAQPVHSRLYWFSPGTGRSHVVEPIILDTWEFSGPPHTWSPLRTAVTFFAPPDGALGAIFTRLYLICPKPTIQAVDTTNNSSYFLTSLFPSVSPGLFTGVSQDLRGVVFNTDETPLVDIHTTCDCVRVTANISQNVPPAAANSNLQSGISTVYSGPQVTTPTVNGTTGSFTKLTTDPIASGGIFPFTGYRSTFAGPVNDFFGRMSNGNYLNIDGRTPPVEPPVTNAR